jgi:two-component system chemotaxis response regulator CheB
VEVVPRPTNARPAAIAALAQDLVGRIRDAAAHARPVPLAAQSAAASGSWRAAGVDPQRRFVVIGASTGGTRAIEDFLGQAPPDFPATVIVQHMPAGFTQSFAQRLNSLSSVSVSEACEGDLLVPGRVLIARGDTHVVVRSLPGGWRVHYTDRLPVNRHCPSVDVLFDSAAAVGPAAIGVLLTGMGDDGARGLCRMRACGALTLGQSKHSCVVYGMPKVAADLGAVQHTAAPGEMPALILRLAQHPERRPARAWPRA